MIYERKDRTVMKMPIGFAAESFDESAPAAGELPVPAGETERAVQSLARVHFPEDGRTLTYYNDRFDLREGDIVFVEGSMAGKSGRVVSLTRSFRIRLSDYKRVIGRAERQVRGRFYLSPSHFISFDRGALPFAQAQSWFMAGEREELLTVREEDAGFCLDDPNLWPFEQKICERGVEYVTGHRVCYLEKDGERCRAIVQGTEAYTVEFSFRDRVICDLLCDCPYAGPCKHEVAALLQLKTLLELIEEEYAPFYNSYFCAIGKAEFFTVAVEDNPTGSFVMGE